MSWPGTSRPDHRPAIPLTQPECHRPLTADIAHHANAESGEFVEPGSSQLAAAEQWPALVGGGGQVAVRVHQSAEREAAW